MPKLTHKRLKELLNYDPITGVWTWKVKHIRIKAGGIAGTVNYSGYRSIKINKIHYISSRLAWFYMEGYWPEHEIDHKNNIRDDNRWSNLRHVTKQCNSRNRKIRIDNKSGIKGVSWCRRAKKWRAYITSQLKTTISLGNFTKKIDAVNERWKAESRYNFQNCQTTSTAYLYLKENAPDLL